MEYTQETLEQMQATELAAKADSLWASIANCKNKDERKQLVLNYNAVAQHYNERVGREDLTVITRSTVVTNEIPAHEIAAPVKRTAAKPAPAPAPVAKRTRTAATTAAVPGEPKPGSVIAQILDLHRQGLSNKEIVEQGYNKSTVNRQVNEYKKRKANGNK